MDKPILEYEKMIQFIYDNSCVDIEDIERVIDLETEYMRLIVIIEDIPMD